MRFTFNFANDFGEPVGSCVRCGTDTRERALISFKRESCPFLSAWILVYFCRLCLHDSSLPFWFFHEFMQRAVLKARDQADAGESVYHYENSFTWQGGNGSPLSKKSKSNGRRSICKKLS